MGGGAAPNENTKTVIVLGAAYGGARAAQILAAGLPEDWKVILIDRNSHANHVYVMPRFAVLPGHEYKAFIPYTNVFLVDPPKLKHIHLQAQVNSIRPTNITISRSFPELGIPTTTIAFDYAIYALGAHLPPPLNLWGTTKDATDEVTGDTALFTGSKIEACEWFKEKQKIIEKAQTVLVVGGGALGIQFATDIKSVYPTKKITLLHSRSRLLPRFDEKMHEEIEKSCVSLDIELILGERLDLDSIENGSAKINQLGKKVVRTVTGREIEADLFLLCTGQAPNTGLLNTMDPATVNKDTGLARVLRTLQLQSLSEVTSASHLLMDALEKLSVSEDGVTRGSKEITSYPHIFAIGDAADAFGAIPAGHNAYAQGEVAARNIIRLVKNKATESSSERADVAPEPLENYNPGPPAIKVSLGLKKAVYQMGPTIDVKNDGVPDLQAASIWPYFGIKVEKDEDMIP
ncbi:hypothetical protein GALMADRAFT_74880 [Galerina marginata CBS 339.88]|uniref:FAD/NAD(P)-binding domain-containing protein n=1 Tax=Galerina marginata (strain CBS 339.88) TaxID=685588 RepID=A0A067SNG9_GALM3|nr:hypothetical protein GALMADRAFT_74880 [Galerina marginata CBS 339.88]